jgi:hypothetical protein
MVSFPKINVNLDVYSLMQGMMKRDTGCLIRLANLVVVEEISKGLVRSSSASTRAACDCLSKEAEMLPIQPTRHSEGKRPDV